MLNYDVKTGRLTKDPELRTSTKGDPVVTFTLAVQRNYKVGDEYPVDFINFVAWRNTAEFICKNFKKGSMMTAEGSLETRKYTDKDNNQRTAFEIKVDRAHFGESRPKQDSTSTNEPPVADSVGGYTNDFTDATPPFDGDFDPFS